MEELLLCTIILSSFYIKKAMQSSLPKAREGWVWRRFDNVVALPGEPNDAMKKQMRWVRRYLRWDPVDEVLSLHKYAKANSPATWKINARQLVSISDIHDNLRDQLDKGFLASLKRQWLGYHVPKNAKLMLIKCRNEVNNSIFDVTFCGETVSDSQSWHQTISNLLNLSWYSNIAPHIPQFVNPQSVTQTNGAAISASRKSNLSSLLIARNRTLRPSLAVKIEDTSSVNPRAKSVQVGKFSSLRNDITKSVAEKPVSPFELEYERSRVRGTYLMAKTSLAAAGKSPLRRSKSKRFSSYSKKVAGIQSGEKAVKKSSSTIQRLDGILNELQLMAEKRASTVNSKRATLVLNNDIRDLIQDLDSISINSADMRRESSTTIDNLQVITESSEFFLSVLNINRSIARVLADFEKYLAINDSTLNQIYADAEKLATQFQSLQTSDTTNDLHRRVYDDFSVSLKSLQEAVSIHDYLLTERVLKRMKGQVNEMRSVQRFSETIRS